jgi:ABC-type bacteriocin/lantibiotic exporter with double-glycine peptidase domain
MDFIFEAPEGIRAPISPDGHGLSGGQTQRLAIARALFAQPELLIMDEATSALDLNNENIIKETIRGLDKSITVVIIAHRLTTVENCDRIFWLDNGRLRAAGPPAEILPRYQAAEDKPAAR